MAIVNSVQRIMNGFGNGSGAGSASNPSGYATANAVAQSGASTVTAVTMGTQGYTNGRVRCKVYGGGSSTTTAQIQVTVTDGTNTYLVAETVAYEIGNGANSGMDIVFPVNVDINIATVTITVLLTVGTTTASLDYEICLNP